MPRIRSIKPSFWTDEKLSALAPLVRMTFLGLISAMADDDGRCKGDPRLVKAAVWPLDDDITASLVREHITQLVDAGRVVAYEVDGAAFLQIANWKRHQRIDKPRHSELPPPPEPSPTAPRPFVETSAKHQGDIGARAEADREWDRDREAERDADATILLADEDPLDLNEHPAPPAPRVVLPPKARTFLARFYELATEKRRLDVTDQVYRALDPGCEGARLRRGVYVKARDAAHLEACCEAVMADPPRAPDAAIVILLEKLKDPPPGPSAAERRAGDERARVALEEQYHAEAKRAGIRWANEHPEEYRALAAPIEAEFSGVGGIVGKMARESALAQRCAEAAGFPAFDAWQRGHAHAEVA